MLKLSINQQDNKLPLVLPSSENNLCNNKDKQCFEQDKLISSDLNYILVAAEFPAADISNLRHINSSAQGLCMARLNNKMCIFVRVNHPQWIMRPT